MKLQKRFLRKYNGKDYYKFMINIPPEIVKEAGFSEGQNIEISASKDKIIIKKNN